MSFLFYVISFCKEKTSAEFCTRTRFPIIIISAFYSCLFPCPFSKALRLPCCRFPADCAVSKHSGIAEKLRKGSTPYRLVNRLSCGSSSSMQSAQASASSGSLNSPKEKRSVLSRSSFGRPIARSVPLIAG